MSKKRATGRVLYRVMLTHVLVSVPPAVATGFFVADLNRRAITTEVENVHVAVAARLRDHVVAEVKGRSAGLNESERILAMPDVTLEKKKVLLSSIVAAETVPYLALHRPDGAFDSAISVPERREPRRDPLAGPVLEEAQARGYAVTDATFEKDQARVSLIVPWKMGGELVGYVATELLLADVAKLMSSLREQFLGAEGRLDLVDGERRLLLSSEPVAPGSVLGEGTPFSSMRGGTLREGMVAIDMGTSSRFTDPEGVERFGSVVTAPQLRWMIGSSRPLAIALRAVEETRKRTMLVAIVAAFSAGLVALLFARGLSEPIRLLTQAVRKSASSGFRGRVDVPVFGELVDLRAAYNDALGELDRYRAELKSTAQVRMRMARFLPPPVLHQMMSSEIAVAASGTEQEVTVFYADVEARGASTTQSVARDQLVQLLSDLFAATCTIVQQKGGRIDHYSGDAVIGLFFGDVEARARQALDAAKGALETARALAKEGRYGAAGSFGIAIGLASGRGTIGNPPDGARDSVAVVGDIVGLAAELRRRAGDGALAVDQATYDVLSKANIAGDFVKVKDGEGAPCFRWRAKEPG